MSAFDPLRTFARCLSMRFMAAREKTFTRPQLIAQVVVVLVTAVTATLTADALDFRSPANALWMVGFPALLGVVLNSGWLRKALVAGALVLLSLVTTIIVGVIFTSYG